MLKKQIDSYDAVNSLFDIGRKNKTYCDLKTTFSSHVLSEKLFTVYVILQALRKLNYF